MTDAVAPTAFWGGIGEYVQGITVYADNRPEGCGPTGTCIRERYPVIHNDFLHDPQTLPWRDSAAPFGIASAAAFPIERAGEVWGALTIYSDEVDRFGDEDVKLVEKVAEDIGFALDNLDREFRRKRTEEALLESENKFKSFSEQALAGIYIIQDGVFKYVNPKFAQMFGYTVEECLNDMPFKILVYAKDLATVEGQVRRRTSGEAESVHYNFRGLKKNGQIFHVEIYGSAIVYKGKLAATGTILDITERKQAEEALRESEDKFRNLFNNSGVGMFRSRLDGSETLDVNEKFLKIVGMTRAETQGTPSVKFWADPKERDAMVRRLVAKGRVSELEVKMLNKQGEVRDCITSLVLYREQGIVEGTIIDITEHRRMEKELRDSEVRLRQIIDLVPHMIFVKDWDGKYLLVNKAVAEANNTSVSALTGKYHADIHPDSSELQNMLQDDQEVMMTGKMKFIPEEPYTDAHGNRRFHQAIKVPFHIFGDKTPAVLGVAIDITERKLAEGEKKKLEAQLLQSQKVEAIGTLAGGIAHDFNNILQPIIGYTEMALSELSPSSSLRVGLEQVVNASLRAKELIRQILAISRSAQEQQRIPIDISSIIKEALKLLRSSLPTSIEIRTKIQTGVSLADPNQIHQVLMNLCTNAAHAMDDKGILEVRLSPVDLSESDLAGQSIVDLKPGPYLKLSVSDTGAGIDAETMGRIFDPYFTTKEVGKGTGLGLAVVDGIVKRHEGAIAIRSEPGKGSTFSIYIPRVDVESEAAMQVDGPLQRGSERILLVDDEPAVMEMGTRLLERLGYKVTSQTDSVKALEIFRSNPDEFDLVMTDYTMPNLTGMDLAMEVLRIRPDMPIMLCTGFSEKITTDSVKGLGMKLLMKPYGMRQISEAVRKILDAQKGG